MPRLVAVGVFCVILWLILDREGPVKPFPSYGPVEVFRHPFLLVASIFALYITVKLHHWLLDYKNYLYPLPIPVLICWAVSECLVVLSCFVPKYWLLVIAFLMIARMMMDSWCRYKSVQVEKRQWNVSGIIRAAFCCVAMGGTIWFATWKFVDDAKLLDYITILPVMLIIIPRVLMDSKDVREVRRFADYAWYPAVTVFVFVTGAAHICFRKLLIIIGGDLEPAQTDILMCNLLSIFVILYLLGLMGCFWVFPRASAAKKEGTK